MKGLLKLPLLKLAPDAGELSLSGLDGARGNIAKLIRGAASLLPLPAALMLARALRGPPGVGGCMEAASSGDRSSRLDPCGATVDMLRWCGIGVRAAGAPVVVDDARWCRRDTPPAAVGSASESAADPSECSRSGTCTWPDCLAGLCRSTLHAAQYASAQSLQ
jgi:hypothetical protein